MFDILEFRYLCICVTTNAAKVYVRNRNLGIDIKYKLCIENLMEKNTT